MKNLTGAGSFLRVRPPAIISSFNLITYLFKHIETWGLLWLLYYLQMVNN